MRTKMVMNHTDEMLNNMTVIKDGVNTTLVTVWPPLDMRGVTQPIPSTKDIIVIMFMILLWIYSIYLTARAYKKLLSDGRAETEIQLVDWWRTLLENIVARRKSPKNTIMKETTRNDNEDFYEKKKECV